MSVPVQKPGRSRQDYQTPPEFISRVKMLLGISEFTIDLAASTTNAQAPWFFSEEEDALKQEWAYPGWGWLNPPFGRVGPWLEKAYMCESQVAMLVPASVGANWWADYVHHKALVLLLNGRLTFVGEKGPFPKDCALLLYNCYDTIGSRMIGYRMWEWKAEGELPR